ncbi:MAG: sugar phosphate isomerase/epimerase family protein, partial [Terriglobales bacterium]
MRLCFDATRFGSGLDGAIDLAAQKQLAAVEFSFAPFSASGKSARLDDKERKHLTKIAELGRKKGVEIACLNLDYCLDPEDKRSAKQFSAMVTKLAQVARALECTRISFSLAPGLDNGWKAAFEQTFNELQPTLSENGVRLLLRCATPAPYRGQSLKKWRGMEPQDWRDLLSIGQGELSLSFSPADCVWLGIDYLQVLLGLTAAIEHIEAHDIEINRSLLTDSGMFGPLWWRYRLIGKGQVDWRQLIEALKLYDFKGTFSVHLDDEFVPPEHDELESA